MTHPFRERLGAAAAIGGGLAALLTGIALASSPGDPPGEQLVPVTVELRRDANDALDGTDDIDDEADAQSGTSDSTDSADIEPTTSDETTESTAIERPGVPVSSTAPAGDDSGIEVPVVAAPTPVPVTTTSPSAGVTTPATSLDPPPTAPVASDADPGEQDVPDEEDDVDDPNETPDEQDDADEDD